MERTLRIDGTQRLVNPYFIKQLPGRKSDVKDARWIAEYLLKNLIKGSKFMIAHCATRAYVIQYA